MKAKDVLAELHIFYADEVECSTGRHFLLDDMHYGRFLDMLAIASFLQNTKHSEMTWEKVEREWAAFSTENYGQKWVVPWGNFYEGESEYRPYGWKKTKFKAFEDWLNEAKGV